MERRLIFVYASRFAEGELATRDGKFCAIGYLLRDIGADVDSMRGSGSAEDIVADQIKEGLDHVVREMRERGLIDPDNKDTATTKEIYEASDQGDWSRVRELMEKLDVDFNVSEEDPPLDSDPFI